MKPLSFLSSRLRAAQQTNTALKATVSCLMYLGLMLVVFAQNPNGILRERVVDAASKPKEPSPHAGAQITADNFLVYRAGGGLGTLADIVKAMADYDVVLLGETHDDPVAHFLEAELLWLAYEHHTPRRPIKVR